MSEKSSSHSRIARGVLDNESYANKKQYLEDNSRISESAFVCIAVRSYLKSKGYAGDGKLSEENKDLMKKLSLKPAGRKKKEKVK